MNIINYLQPIALAAVLIVLFLGLFNMMRGGSSNKSQTFMRWRVGLQFVAIVLLVAGLWFSRH
jgi:Hypoxia induced protein conserved region